jgi:hypothetical protein
MRSSKMRRCFGRDDRFKEKSKPRRPHPLLRQGMQKTAATKVKTRTLKIAGCGTHRKTKTTQDAVTSRTWGAAVLRPYAECVGPNRLLVGAI